MASRAGPAAVSGTGPVAVNEISSAPLRRCVGCRRRQAKSNLVRLAEASGRVVVDHRKRLPGRGAYVCRLEGCVEAATARNGARLLRALRCDGSTVTVEADALRSQCLSAAERRHQGVCL